MTLTNKLIEKLTNLVIQQIQLLNNNLQRSPRQLKGILNPLLDNHIFPILKQDSVHHVSQRSSNHRPSLRDLFSLHLNLGRYQNSILQADVRTILQDFVVFPSQTGTRKTNKCSIDPPDACRISDINKTTIK